MGELNIKVSANEYSLLKNGNEFLEASKRCAAEDEKGTIHILGTGEPTLLPAVTVVNASFACEMYLKALLLHYVGEYPKDGKRGHNLKDLFCCLPENVKDRIDDIIGRMADGSSIFEKFSESHAKDFVDATYYVSNEGWQELSPVRVQTFAFNLGQIANYLLEKNSDL